VLLLVTGVTNRPDEDARQRYPRAGAVVKDTAMTNQRPQALNYVYNTRCAGVGLQRHGAVGFKIGVTMSKDSGTELPAPCTAGKELFRSARFLACGIVKRSRAVREHLPQCVGIRISQPWRATYGCRCACSSTSVSAAWGAARGR